ncbi:MAG: Asp-tRNA(Asn)/Glu-tRNA(Gln) amidotransferase subunit GatB [Bacteroidetes bacterium]|nr:Asp-tRNA(Asn)/Glu-tRNA(Gln) amidotransferase subunit GatB [Bacteroidota bacterium]
MKSAKIKNKYQAVIGLEVHCQLLTKSKAYSSDSTQYGNLPNTNLSVITLAHPGTLPKVNKKTVEYAVKLGLACNCKINRNNGFDRKNYFYPDLPKGYQITQDKKPLCSGGYIRIRIKDNEKKIGITRIHMEEDAGKSMHLDGEIDTLIDFNRAGVPLIEIVSEPEIRTSEEAYAYLAEIKKLVRYLDICDGNMEEGSLRCDANISVMLKDAKEFGTRVEVKNMNSFRNVQRAIEFEINRQTEAIENGTPIVHETRNFDAVTGKTKAMRTKEELNDYRYFPEPDLQPLIISEEWLKELKASIPSLPHQLYDRFVNEYGLPDYDANVLTDTKEVALYFETLCKHTKNYKAASNWVMGPVKSYLNELNLHIEQFPLVPESLSGIIELVEQDKVSHSVAVQKIFPAMLKANGKSAMQIAQKQNLIQQSDEGSIQTVIDEILSRFPEKVTEYKAGKKGLIGMFMGEIMKMTKGKANPKLANELLRKSLER